MYFCFGILVPLVLFEAFSWIRNPKDFARNLRRLTLREFLLCCACGFLNVFGIVTYFMATVLLPSAVAFTIFLSTPLVSISLGVFCFRELEGEPFEKRALVATIMACYVAAICFLSFNALQSV